MTQFTLETLEQSIAHRAQGGGEDSWTARLYSAGMEKAAQKMGEEAVETVIAAVAGDRKALIGESADLLYHWLVVLAVAGVPLADVLCELEARSAQSGIAEKAGRKSP